MLDKKRLDKHLFLLEYLPSLVSCLIVVILFVILNLHYQNSHQHQHLQFVKALLSNAAVIDSHNFSQQSKSLLLTGHYNSLTLLDAGKNTLSHLGMPLSETAIQHISHGAEKWIEGNTRHFLFSSETESGEKYWVHTSTASNDIELWVYRSILLVLMVTVLGAGIIYLNSRRLRKLFDAAQAPIERALDNLSTENYGKQVDEKQASFLAPLARKLNTLSLLLQDSTQKMQQTIDQSVKELEETLETVEIQNIEIDLARKTAIKANQAKSEFLASTSHEIRTPLNGILGFTNLMRKTKLSPQQEEYLETIEDSAQVLLLNINDIIDFSRLEIGKLNLEYKPIYIQELIRESQKYIVTHTNLDDVILNTQEKNPVPAKLLGDPLRVKQVYTNLLSNALMLCQSHKITTALEINNRDDNQAALKVELVCHGEQIDIRELQTAQTLLRSADPAHEKLTNKNHMGLVIAKGLVERMNGEIGLSTRDKETVFWFTVLLGKPNMDSSTQKRTSPTSILVVDDNPSNRRLICELLSDMRVSVTSVGSGEEAIDVCKKRGFSLILMDIQMPGLNGFETTKILRENEAPGERTPIVALTAHAVEEAKSHLLLSGLDDFVSKPIGETELKELLARWANYSLFSSTPQENKQPCNPDNNRLNSGSFTSNKPVDISESLNLAKGKADLARDMLSMLIESLRTDIPQIKQAWNDKDYETAQDLVHKIHGGACYCGVPELLSSSKVLDKTMKDKQYDRCKPLLDAFYYSSDELLKWADSHDVNSLFAVNIAQ